MWKITDAIGSAIITAIVSVLLNLISTGIQQHSWKDYIPSNLVWIMIVAAIGGIVVSHFIETRAALSMPNMKDTSALQNQVISPKGDINTTIIGGSVRQVNNIQSDTVNIHKD